MNTTPLLTVFMCSSIVAVLFMYQIPPYMDEPFHFYQCMRYAQLDFTWDNKITTFPGLYIFSSPLLLVIRSFISSFPLLLTISRLTNALVSYYCFTLLLKFPSDIRLSFILFPFHFFYTHFFYTDSGSLIFLTLFFLQSRGSPRPTASMLVSAVLAILFRQTNILYISAILVLRYFHLLQNWITTSTSILSFLRSSVYLVRYFVFLLPLYIGFGCFLILNDFSLVLGDKSAHELVFHPAMIVYFSFFSIYLFPEIFKYIRISVYSTKQVFLYIATFVLVYALFVWFLDSKISHPYLISDNRHYLFYFYKNVILAYSGYVLALVPAVVFSTLLFTTYSVLHLEGVVFLLLLLIPLILTPLFEVRYFVPPILLLLLLFNDQTIISNQSDVCYLSLLRVVTCFVINSFTFISFVFPFKTDENGEFIRFVW
ncbi:hypothetical protein GEMRC1_000800 [Eukaryota sp. GEM-RC1]